MKFLPLLLVLFPLLAFGRIGPDLSAGTNVEYFTKLRMDYAKNPKSEFYPMWTLAPEYEAIVKAYRDGDVDQVFKLADSWLNKCPIDADTHLRVAMCCKENGDLPGYVYHFGVFYGLLQSIVAGGDGHTPETAFKVISIQEEYSLIQEIGGKLDKQTLVAGPCDKMDVTRRDGEVKLTLYFNVAIPMNALAKELTPKK